MRDKRKLTLAVDYGQKWPLSDIMFSEEPEIDWPSLISSELIERLENWAAFFNKYADWETQLFGSEERRRWFDLEGFKLLEELKKQVGDKFDFTLFLWF